MQPVDLDALKHAFASPAVIVDSGAPRAAVAAVFRAGNDGHGAELLFIQRAAKDGDPWSGQMALPGGRAEKEDPTLAATAERETLEEVGLDLAGAARLGRIDDVSGGVRSITVSVHGYWLTGTRPPLTPNYEVADTVWFSIADLANPANHVDYLYPPSPHTTFPGIQIGDRDHQIVWGLTLRILTDLFSRLFGDSSPPHARS